MNTSISDIDLKKTLQDFTVFFDNYKPQSSDIKSEKLSSAIDHTLLKPEASHDEITNLCREALRYKFASVCVNSSNVTRCYDILKGSGVRICSVIGFPLGAAASDVKVYETEYVISEGASEVDMVINIGELKSRNYDYVYNDIRAVVNCAHNRNALCKVIIETCLLSDEEKAASIIIAREAGADFIKTSTGFSKGGAELRDVAMMKYLSEGKMKVKASGGIRSLEDALKMISYGADRLGTSSGVKIIDSYNKD